MIRSSGISIFHHKHSRGVSSRCRGVAICCRVTTRPQESTHVDFVRRSFQLCPRWPIRPARTYPDSSATKQPAREEVSAVTYNWDTGTLFVVGDGGTSIVQVSLTGQLINSMTLAPGSSPQGTTFYDTEGLTYIGGGQFVMTEERDRQAVEFTYTAGTTLDRSGAKTVDLGTFVQNIGLEGVSYDPQTGGYILVKETL